LISTSGTCTFSNNQCFISLPVETVEALTIAIQSNDSIVAMGNSVRGRKKTDKTPSMVLGAPAITVIGNITYSFITTNPSVPATIMQLNVIA
jgi:hypothetical protein